SQVQLTAVPQDTQGRLLAGRPTTWRSGNDTVATVSATGLVTGLVEGYTFIMADVEGQSDGTHLSVSASLAPIGSVTVTPESARGDRRARAFAQPGHDGVARNGAAVSVRPRRARIPQRDSLDPAGMGQLGPHHRLHEHHRPGHGSASGFSDDHRHVERPSGNG